MAKTKRRWILLQCFNIIINLISFTPEQNKLTEGGFPHCQICCCTGASSHHQVTHPPNPSCLPTCASKFLSLLRPSAEQPLRYSTSNRGLVSRHLQLATTKLHALTVQKTIYRKKSTPKMCWSPAQGKRHPPEWQPAQRDQVTTSTSLHSKKGHNSQAP